MRLTHLVSTEPKVMGVSICAPWWKRKMSSPLHDSTTPLWQQLVQTDSAFAYSSYTFGRTGLSDLPLPGRRYPPLPVNDEKKSTKVNDLEWEGGTYEKATYRIMEFTRFEIRDWWQRGKRG